MNLEKVTEQVIKGTKYKEEYETLRNQLNELSASIEEQIRQIRQCPTITSLKEQIKMSATTSLKENIIDLFDDLLTKLISKRVVVTLPDNIQKIALSYAGISVDKQRTYSWCTKDKYNYLPTLNNYDDKWHGYLSALDHYIMLRNRIHKRDKKEILTICGKFVKQYRQLDHHTESSDTYKTFDEDKIIQYLYRGLSYSYSGSFNFEQKTIKINKLRISFTTRGIDIHTYHNDEPKTFLSLNPSIDTNDSLILLELLKDDQIKKVIYEAVDKFTKQNKDFRELATKLQEELQPYAVLDLF